MSNVAWKYLYYLSFRTISYFEKKFCLPSVTFWLIHGESASDTYERRQEYA